MMRLPTYGTRTSGSSTEPSGRWPCSISAAQSRGPAANVATPRLEVGEVTDRRDLQPALHAWRVYLKVEDPRRRERQVACAQVDDPVRQLKFLQRTLTVGEERLELRLRGLRRANAHKFQLVEFVHSLEATGVLARGPRLAAKARRVRHVPLGQILRFQGLVLVQAGERNFTGGNQPEIVGLGVVRFVGEFRQMTGADHERAAHEVGDKDLGIGAGVQVGAELNEPAHETCAVAIQKGET